jgi:MYXO-CTERM domain-containing protein
MRKVLLGVVVWGLCFLGAGAQAADKPDMTHLWRLAKTSWNSSCSGKPTHFMTTSQSECNVAKSIGYQGNCSTGNYDAEHYVSSVSFPNSVTVYRMSKGGTCGCKDTFIYTSSSYWKSYFGNQGYNVESGKEYYAWDPSIGSLNTINDWGLVPVYHAYSSGMCDNFYSEHPDQYNSKLAAGYTAGFETNPTAVAYYAADGWIDLGVQCSKSGCSWTLTGPGGWSVSKTGNYTFPSHSLPTHGYRLQCSPIPGMVTKAADQPLYLPFFTSTVAKCEYSCDDKCPYAGKKECSGNGYRTCQADNNGCLNWSGTTSCDDYDPCTIGDGCANGFCTQGTPMNCSYLNDTCNTGQCTGGQCIALPKAGACNDNNPCTTGDQCANGQCQGTPMDCSYLTTDCKVGSCSGGQCIAQNLSVACDDANPCTIGDSCANGVCASGPEKDCSQLSDSCNTGLCAGGQCVAQPKNGACDDANPCTIGDVCANGTCQSGAPLDCSNLTNACYDGVCQGGICQKVPKPGMECDDGIACTLDSCDVQAGCLHEPSVALCDDGNGCTVDECLLATGCLNNPAPGPCNDGDGCTVGDGCVDGACSPGTPKTCSDDNPCTDDSCVPATGDCAFVPNTLPCDDGADCTLNDGCVGGVCTGTPLQCDDNIACTTDSCQEGVGCQYAPADASCDDGNPCTADTCSAVLGCQFAPVAGPCENGDPCTVGDACQEGLCVAGTPKTCDDANPCTADSCVPETGDCLQAPIEAPCNDNDACTTGDSCVAGKCQGELVVGCCFANEDCPDPGLDCLTVACVAGQCKETAFCLEGQCGPSPCDAQLTCNTCLAIEVCIQGWCQEECGPEDKEMTRCTNDGKTLEKCIQDQASGLFYWQATDCPAAGEQGCAYSQDKGLNVCCTPQCDGKVCGKPSACGISCGLCGDDQFCCLPGEDCGAHEAANLFQCLDCCAGMECGLSTQGGCSQQCGTCADGKSCKAGQCVSGCEDANVDAAGNCAGAVAWWCEKTMGKETLKSLDCAEYVATCCFDDALGRVGCCGCDTECEDNGWACGTNSCGQPCGDFKGDCGPGFNCIPESHQCLCQMPELCYPDVQDDVVGTTDTGGGITVPIEDDESGGGSRSGNCSSSPGRSSALGFWLLLLAALLAMGQQRRTRPGCGDGCRSGRLA